MIENKNTSRINYIKMDRDASEFARVRIYEFGTHGRINIYRLRHRRRSRPAHEVGVGALTGYMG
ncbi:hypothetical protein RED65_02308 [Oceanobacter sp. RED65]|uniref:Uncharacterized protein n=1 Tax=Bermanella marisrubri TaxID=207949 RepID=Q1MYC8_9GAMM|nr:hypothetical protein RED65_02308 [Oceanobacter sp. RED65] [Bermanella marisrubri]